MDTLPRREFVSIDISPEEYALFLEAIPNETRLPADFRDWRAFQARNKRATEIAGMRDKPVRVSFDGFLTYAKKIGLPVCYALLLTYAISEGSSNGSDF